MEDVLKKYVYLFFGKGYKGYSLNVVSEKKKKVSYLMTNGFTVKSGFELHIIFGIVSLEHFMYVWILLVSLGDGFDREILLP